MKKSYAKHFIYILIQIVCHILLLHTVYGQNGYNHRYILPSETDNNIKNWNTPHYVVYNKEIVKEPELIIFFPGTSGNSEDISFFIDSISKNVTHTICLQYPNTMTSWIYCQDKEDICFKNFRSEVLWGANDTIQPIQNIKTPDSVINRITKLIEYLNINYKSENWGEYLKDDQIIWSKIILGGFSQGGGLSLFISKIYHVKRVVLLSSPSDYMIKTNTTATWLAKKGPTPSNDIYCFSSLADDVVPYYIQYANWKYAGIFGDSISLRPNLKLAFQHQIVLKEGRHTEPIVNKKYTPIWNYLFDSTKSTTIWLHKTNLSVKITALINQIKIEFDNQIYEDINISIYNINGKEIYTGCIRNNISYIATSTFPKGVYFIKMKSNNLVHSYKLCLL